jgi:hypothetical protein
MLQLSLSEQLEDMTMTIHLFPVDIRGKLLKQRRLFYPNSRLQIPENIEWLVYSGPNNVIS